MKSNPIFDVGNDASRYTPAHLPQYTSFGCYTLLYVCDDGETLCAECALDALTAPDRDPREVPTMYQTYDEGPSKWCAECNRELESSYGDPDGEREAAMDKAEMEGADP